MKIRTLLGLAAIGGVAYAHNKRGGEWTLDSIKDTLRDLFSGVQDKVRGFADEAEGRHRGHRPGLRLDDEVDRLRRGQRPRLQPLAQIHDHAVAQEPPQDGTHRRDFFIGKRPLFCRRLFAIALVHDADRIRASAAARRSGRARAPACAAAPVPTR